MLFNSIQFLVFFPVVVFLYFVLPHRFRWLHLLVASCVFYMAFIPSYILILLVTITIDYTAGRIIGKMENKKKKKLWLVISIISTCLVLAIFKYYNFFIENFNWFSDLMHRKVSLKTANIILPIGLSFHTFQSLSYVIEVYRGNQKPEKHFGRYSLYVMFFPQLAAGPIERPQNLLHQFYKEHVFDYARVSEGLKWMLWGMFKKVVIADNLSLLVNPVFNQPQNFHGIQNIFATLCFSFQIYCDFSGYSDIAYGSAKVMGFQLTRNFTLPYYSSSVTEFWRRWHISLSSWFRDYVYIPLGGNRVLFHRQIFNLLVTFVLSGLWHGASWTFIIWGLLNWFYVVVELLFRKAENSFPSLKQMSSSKLLSPLKTFLTFMLICFAWIFFRAKDFSHLKLLLHGLFNFNDQLTGFPALIHSIQSISGNVNFLWLLLSFLLFLIIDYWMNTNQLNVRLYRFPKLVRWSFYYVIIFWILLFGMFQNSPHFIYFQF